MIEDPIIAELRQTRDEHAARFNYDVHAICEDYRRMQREQNLKVVSLAPVPAKPRSTIRNQRSS